MGDLLGNGERRGHLPFENTRYYLVVLCKIKLCNKTYNPIKEHEVLLSGRGENNGENNTE